MGEHTPGPWEVRDGWAECFGPTIYTASAHELEPLAAVDRIHSKHSEADARLIAAAPEQHDALKVVVAAIRAYLVAAGRAPDNRDPEEINAAALALVDALPIGDAAIAKAKGSETVATE